MAQAADYPTLYDFEGQIETAADTVLSTLLSDVRKPRDTDDLATPRATCQLIVSGDKERYAQLPNGDLRGNLYGGTLEVTIATHRRNNASSHNSFRAKVRTLLQDYRTQFTAALLPYLQILKLVESGNSPVENRDGIDISTMQSSIDFGIRQEAWPA